LHIDPILSLGIIFISGFLILRFINKVRLPAITGDLILGIIIGEEFLNLVSRHLLSASGVISNIVLGLIAFSIGRNFLVDRFRKIGKNVFLISIFEALGTWIVVTVAFHFLLKQPFYLSLIFGAIASATAPAATVMVIREYRAQGLFTNVLLGVVAIDDAWCLMIFSLSLALARTLALHLGGTLLLFEALLKGILEIFGAIGVGIALGFIFSGLSTLVRTQAGLTLYTLGFLLLSIGIALHLHLSILLTAMVLGATVVNLLKEEERFFASLKSIEYPLYLLFFVLAGANLELVSLKHVGILGAFYLVTRVVGKIIGARIGAIISRSPKNIQHYIGFGLIPQAGVALGVALIAKANFQRVGGLIMDTIIGTTVVYELVGPIVTKWALSRAGDIKKKI